MRVYLDHHASTPVLSEVREAMARASVAAWANPSSPHREGREARRWLECARDQFAAAAGAKPTEIFFTSGGTEACNLGVRGLLGGEGASGRVLFTPLAHAAVREAASLGGREVEQLSLGSGAAADALASLDAAVASLGEGDVLALNWAHHETGAILPVRELARAARKIGARVFVDGAQALGKLALGALEDFDAVAFGGAKFGGPKGSGALYVRRGTPLEPVLVGGGQERGLRGGTPDVVRCVGFAEAAERAVAGVGAMARVGELRDELEAGLRELGGLVNAAGHPRVRTVTQVAFEGHRSDVLVPALDLEGVSVSAGSACSSGVAEPLRSVLALHPDEPWRAGSSVRFSLSAGTTRDEVQAAVGAVARVLGRGG